MQPDLFAAQAEDVTHRFGCYLAASGLTLDHTRHEAWRYVTWIGQQWSVWKQERGITARRHGLTEADHKDFDAWLAARVLEGKVS